MKGKELKSKIIKEKICKNLENKKSEEHGKCFLLIIPFMSRNHAEGFVKEYSADKFARNLLEVDDNFYDEILERYKLYKEGVK